MVTFSPRILEARRFFLEPTLPGRLSVLSAGCEHCAPDYRVQRSRARCYKVEFVASGSGRLVLHGRAVTLVPGTFFLCGPRVTHEITGVAEEPMVKYFVTFTGSAATGLLRRCGLPPGTAGQCSAPEEICSAMEDLIRDGLRHNAYSERLCSLDLERTLLLLADTATAAGSRETAAFATFDRCRRHIARSYRELLSPGQVASECHVDPAHLCRLFRRFSGTSPGRYLTRLRMSHAAESLRRPGASVKTVAADLGFDEPCNFSRSFKRLYGVAPSRFVGLHDDETDAGPSPPAPGSRARTGRRPRGAV